MRRFSRKGIVAIICGAVIVVVVGGLWLVASLFISPAQQAARAKPPAMAPATAAVKRGDLSKIVSTGAQIMRQNTETVSIPSSGGGLTTVTRQAVTAGAQVTPGSSVLEVNGRPLFAVVGTFPFYRDMTVGMTGPDVTQLQAALRSAGESVTVDGTFGTATANAVSDFYRRAGYSAPTEANPVADASNTDASNTGGADGSGTATSSVSPSASPQGGAAAQDSASTSTNTPSQVVYVPQSEWIVLQTLPAYLTQEPSAGAVLDSSSTLTFQQGSVIGEASVDSTVSSQLQTGLSVSLQGASGAMSAVLTGISGVAGSVSGTSGSNPSASGAGLTSSTSAPAAGAGSSGAGPSSAAVAPGATGADSGAGGTSQVTLTFTAPPGSTIPDNWLGANVTAIITVNVAAKDALLVPSVAVVTYQQHSVVYKKQPDGSFVDVEVKELGSIGGESAVSPVQNGQLAVNDLVKIG